jgi:ferredoxin--NADP+ reductase
MSNQTASNDSPKFSASLTRSERITPESSPEEVRNLVFTITDLSFQPKSGQCIRVFAPGQYGNAYHTRYYSLADLNLKNDQQTEFSLCVRRCFYIDEFNGEECKGIASNHLCDLKPGEQIQFNGPYGHPFTLPTNKKADLLMLSIGTGIAPFRDFIRSIYEEHGGWQGKVRLFHGAKTGFEMLYMNDENHDLANYYDQKTFKAFQAVSPRPAMEAPIALDKVIEKNGSDVLAMLLSTNTLVYLSGPEILAETADKALARLLGGEKQWKALKQELIETKRWNTVLY